MPAFLSPTEFLKRYDWRWVAKNVLDSQYGSGDPSVATKADLLDPSSDAGAVLDTMISDAEDLVLGACAVGARYSYDDLLTHGGNLLLRVVSDLTLGEILKRRARAVDDYKDMTASYTEGLEYLEQLRRGERIFFNVPNVPEAGLPESASTVPRPGIDPPSITQQAARYFGTTACQNPYNPPH